jgi:putative oxidoreductase
MSVSASVGLLVLRLVLGGLFIGHGTQKLFGWFGGGGPDGTGRFLGSLGYRPGRSAAMLAGLTETAGGSLLAFGMITSLGSAMVIGMMVSAIVSVHLKNGVWNTNGGLEFPLVNAAAAAMLALSGPGRFSLDRALGWQPWGLVVGTLGILLGIAAALILEGWRTERIRSEAVTPTERHQRPAA